MGRSPDNMSEQRAPLWYRQQCATLIEGLVALAPKKRKKRAIWIVVAAVLYVVVALGRDASFRDGVASMWKPAPKETYGQFSTWPPTPVRVAMKGPVQVANANVVNVAPAAPANVAAPT